MPEHDENWDRLIRGLRQGDQQIIAEFFDQHGGKLRGIAEKRMASVLRRRVNPSDVVQSAFRTFFRQAGEGRFQFDDPDQLWSLICAITLTKVRQKARFHRRDQRDVYRESHPDASQEPCQPGFAVFSGRELSPDAAMEFADQFQALMESLDEEEQQ